MNKLSSNYALLISKIDEFIRKYYLNKVVKGGIYLAASFSIAYLFVTLAEYYGNFDPSFRTILFFGFLLLNFSIFLFYIAIPLSSYFKLGKTINHQQAATIIGNHFKPVKDKLLNTLQLKQLSDDLPGQKTLIEASIDQKIADLSPVPFTSAVNINENRRYIKYAAMPLIAILLIFFTAPSIFSESTERLLKYKTQFIKKAPFSFVVLNQDLSTVQGNDLQLRVKLEGNQIPQEVYLQDGVNTFKLDKESVVRFSYTLKNLQQSKLIRLTAGEFSSADYEVKVKKKPSLLKFDVGLVYPSYLKRQNETIMNTGDLTVPIGTLIKWRVNTENTTGLLLTIGDKKKEVGAANANSFGFEYRVLKNINYSIQPVNGEIRQTEPVAFQLSVVPDLHPAIMVSESKDSVNSGLVYFVGQVNDDHGFNKLLFHYRILNAKSENSANSFVKPIAISKNSLQSSFAHFWDVNAIAASPGSQIEYYFEVFDNDGVNGSKVTRSALKLLNIRTEKQVEEKLQANSSSIKSKIAQAVKQAGEVEREAKRLNQDLLNKKSLNFDDKKQLEKLLEDQKELDDLVKQIQDENKQDLREQQENKEIKKDILEKQKQIEDLFNNVLDEKTRELLKNLEKLLQQNNKDLTQTELSKMQVDNKSLKKELDRILELYKQLEFDQKLTETTQKLKELAEEQQKLSDSALQKAADAESLKKEQLKLNEDFESVKKELDQLQQKNEELDEKNDLENTDKAEQEIDQKQEQSSKDLGQKKMKNASENQRQASEKMKQLAEKMDAMQQNGEEAENTVNIQNLREILDNLIRTSFEQEKLMQNFKSTNTADPNYISDTQKQKALKDNLKLIEDSLYSLSKKVPQIQSVVNKEIQSINNNINNALQKLADRNTPEATSNQQFAMTSMNNLALMLSEALDQMQKAQSGGKGKKKQSVSQLSKMQEQLNKNMQKAREQMQKEGPQGQSKQGKGQMSEQLAKMAREQQLIRQGMQEINRELNKDGKNGLGNLDELMKEMEQSETDLVNKKIYQQTITRQQEIMTRLLEAEKAEREREQDNERESKQGTDGPAARTEFMKEFQRIKQQETELLKTVPPSLNSFYKIKVGDYFKFLNSGNDGK